MIIGSAAERFTRRRAAAWLAAGAAMASGAARAQGLAPPSPPGPLVSPQDGIAPAQADVAAGKDMLDRMTVPVMIDGRGPYAFVVDTASNRTAICERVAADLGLISAGPLVVQAATAEAVADSVSIGALNVGVRVARNLRAPVFKRADLGADGLLGIDVLADQTIVMDFRAKRMTITAPTLKQSAGEIVVSARSRYGQLILVDSTFDDTDLYAVIDTGGEASIANSHLRALVDRRRREAAKVAQVIGVTGDAANADYDVLPRVHLSGVAMLNVPVAYADVHAFKEFGLQDKPAMLLGMDLLRHFDRVSVDFRARRVRFLLPADAPVVTTSVPIGVG